jgi:mevalonate kinase
MTSVVLGSGRAPGKVILFGEHAVVYGRPALAVPVTQVQAEVVVERGEAGAGLTIVAADLGETITVRDAPEDHPLAAAARLTLVKFGIGNPDWRVTVRSTIPIASGMGSGAAVSAAIMRALAEAGDQGPGARDQGSGTRDQETAIGHQPLAISQADLSALVYEVERLHHGTPSGVDNTVVVYGEPVYFMRGRPPQTFPIGQPFMLAIADTGIRSPTRVAVGDVRRGWEQEPARFEGLFDQVAAIVEDARTAIADGQPEKLGPLMDHNHALLQEIGVSCPELDVLVAAARAGGAAGAKLSGAGRGGNMIALVAADTAAAVAAALTAAGAVQVIVSEVGIKGEQSKMNA